MPPDLIFMNTFETEFNELSEWIMEKTNIYFEKMKKDKTNGRDSILDYERTQDIKEYNERLAELKLKYNKDITPQETYVNKKTN
jgi:hypothetical protein